MRGVILLIGFTLSGCLTTTQPIDTSKIDAFFVDFVKSDASLLKTNKENFLRLHNACNPRPLAGLRGAALGRYANDLFALKRFASIKSPPPEEREANNQHVMDMVGRGHAKAQLLVATRILGSNPSASDTIAAGEMMIRSADSGCPHAQIWVAFLYQEGFGIQIDPIEAYKWANLAAATGHPYAKILKGRYRRAIPFSQLDRARGLPRDWRHKKQ